MIGSMQRCSALLARQLAARTANQTLLAPGLASALAPLACACNNSLLTVAPAQLSTVPLHSFHTSVRTFHSSLPTQILQIKAFICRDAALIGAGADMLCAVRDRGAVYAASQIRSWQQATLNEEPHHEHMRVHEDAGSASDKTYQEG